MSTEPLPGVGSTIGSYRVEAVLGQGGMGVVYRAEDLRLVRLVALKLLRASLADDRSYRERFLRESRLAASIEHAAIVPIYEAGETDGLLYIAMRFVDGVDLAELLRREGPLAPERAVALVGQLASALDAAHARGLIHRDVKPSNALIGTDGDGEHLYLADFGLTKSAGSHSITGTGPVMGTVLYMAPEVIRGDEPTAAADQYALGCVLYECLTGHVPFDGANQAAAIYGHLETPPPAPSQHHPRLPPEVDAAVQRALAKDPGERWPSCTAFADGARAALHGAGVSVTRRRRAPWRALVTAAGLAALAASASVLLTRDDEGAELAALRSNVVAVVDPTGKLRAQVDFDRAPGRVAANGTAVWVADEDRGTVSRLDPKTHTVRQTIRVGHGSSALAADRDGVWVANRQDGRLLRVAASTNEIVARHDLGGAPSDVCMSGGSVWVANPARRELLRVDGDSGRRRAVPLEVQPERLACGEGSVWASSEAEGRVVQINPKSGRVVRTIEIGVGAGALAVGGGVWVANPLTGIVSRIDRERGAVAATVPVGRDDAPSEIAVGAGGVWVANLQGGTVARIAPARAAVDRKLRLGNPPRGLAIVDGELWIGVTESGAAHRGGTLRQVGLGVSALRPSDSDPAASYGDSTMTAATRDGLMTFRRGASNAYGAVPIPNLAVSLPEVSNAGRTYTFTVRRGIRFSDGRPLRPSDVAYSLNRAVSGGVLASQNLDTVRRADADDAGGTVAVELTRPDPEILFKLATSFGSVVPRGSGKSPAQKLLPGTGPYRVVQLTPTSGFRLERNPYFEVWSAAARPDGFPDAIVVKYMKADKAEAAIRAVATGAADHLDLQLLAQATKLLPELRRRYGERLHSYVPAGLQFLWFNVDSPPFNRLSARRAVGFALDRRAVLRAHGGPAGARLTCRIIPPDLAGHETGPCPYPDRPDLATARRLVRESGTRGMRVTVLSGHPAFSNIMKVVAKTLRQIGYRTTLRSQPIDEFFRGILEPPRHDGNIGPMGWTADYPAPSNFFLPLFKCGRPPANSNAGHYCDARLDALILQAQGLQISRPADANRLWAAADRRVVEQAAGVPLTNGVVYDFVSERVGNYNSNLLFGSKVDQFWVR